jgi:hypothetical protein
MRSHRASTLLAVLIGAATPISHAQAQLRVDGTEFVLMTLDGRTLRSADLVGATLKVHVDQHEIEIEIRSVEEDRAAVGGRVVLHRFVARGANGNSVELCTPDAQGRRLGFPVPDGRGNFELTCTSGAIGKCIRWGYRPWEERPGGPPMRALHRSCIHMARADYGGDGLSSTRDGTLIDIADRFGIRSFHRDLPMTFEAAWSVDGAVCVARPRIADKASLPELAENYPRLAGHLGPEACSEGSVANDHEALVLNRSYAR